ncbi:MAG TPA: C40 family peptidase [Methylomusa anaerophila]|uniref:Gamma-DL-glutamyl hydrolase n=1 Tax=Methylomusa anaerophila TaxID=1930071 RepID=A0A348AM59_9FIRM|nr:C40 family peptidase [Methylomusa anaerophila]BBB92157.1 gamma-DL-glutamyl hydrolase precursor [Methylomusa anaerophila]HML87829.1 C40 family peptidase [Methylomusa anaerophila]
MRIYKFHVTLIALLTFCVTLITPISPAAAFSLTDVLPQAAQTDTSSDGGNMLMNILLGLLLGNFVNKFANVQSKLPDDISKVLGVATGSGTTSGSAKGAQVVETAKTLMGVPYVFGGNSVTRGLDCSSFTQYVMKQNGIRLPRTAAEQFAGGTPVNKTDLRIGDLVFFTTYKPGASHVGFYMGDGNFIHASSAQGQVGISSLSDAYYTQQYIGARRYIK